MRSWEPAGGEQAGLEGKGGVEDEGGGKMKEREGEKKERKKEKEKKRKSSEPQPEARGTAVSSRAQEKTASRRRNRGNAARPKKDVKTPCCRTLHLIISPAASRG